MAYEYDADGNLKRDEDGNPVGEREYSAAYEQDQDGNWNYRGWYQKDGNWYEVGTDKLIGNVAEMAALKASRGDGFGGFFNEWANPLGITGGVEGNKVGKYLGSEAVTKEYYDNPELYTQLAIAAMGAGAASGLGGVPAAAEGSASLATTALPAETALAPVAASTSGSAPFVAAEGLGGVGALGETALVPTAATGGAGTLANIAAATGATAGVDAAMSPSQEAAADPDVVPPAGMSDLPLPGDPDYKPGNLGGLPAAISRIIAGEGTMEDYLSVIGTGGAGVLGYLGSRDAESEYGKLQREFMGLGAPSRARLEASHAPGFSLIDQPGYGDALKRTADISASSYASKFGNPAGSPTAQQGILSNVWNEGYIPALNTYRSQAASAGGLGVNTAGTFGGASVGAGEGKYDAAGNLLRRATDSSGSLAELARQLRQMSSSGGTGTWLA